MFSLCPYIPSYRVWWISASNHGLPKKLLNTSERKSPLWQNLYVKKWWPDRLPKAFKMTFLWWVCCCFFYWFHFTLILFIYWFLIFFTFTVVLHFTWKIIKNNINYYEWMLYLQIGKLLFWVLWKPKLTSLD